MFFQSFFKNIGRPSGVRKCLSGREVSIFLLFTCLPHQGLLLNILSIFPKKFSPTKNFKRKCVREADFICFLKVSLKILVGPLEFEHVRYEGNHLFSMSPEAL